MEINPWTQYIPRGAYTGVVSGVKSTGTGSGPSIPKTDSVVISEEARQSAMMAEMEKDGLSHEAAEKLASGKITIAEPDWETFEVPTLKGQADPRIYDTAYFQAYTKELGELTKRVEAHYAQEYTQIGTMDAHDAMQYLFTRYKLPWMEDVFVPGTQLPRPPAGMSRGEADMAYDQLKGMRFGHGIATLHDPYALGEDGIARLENMEEHARKAAQEVYDAAQKDYDARQETWKAEQKEKYQQTLQRINSGSGTCLGYMSLRSEAGSERSDG